MTIDYRKAFVDLLKNNIITQLPAQEIIDGNKDIALLIWQNYSPQIQYNYDEQRITPPINWGLILKAFSKHTQFWEEAFESNNTYKMLLDENFKNSFPLITSLWLSNDEKLLLAFEKTDDKKFVELLNDTDRKEEIYKIYLLNNLRKIKSEDISRFENDKKFVSIVIDTYPYLYEHLNEKNKHNHDFVKLALKTKSNIDKIPKKYQDNPTIRNYWFNLNLNQFDNKDVAKFTENEKNKFFMASPQLIASLLNNNQKFELKYYAVKLLTNNLEKNIHFFSHKTIEKIKPELLNDLDFKLTLTSFFEKYNGTDLCSKADEKIFSLSEGHKEFKKILDSNLFYTFRQKRISKKLIDSEEYKLWIDTILNKNNQSEITSENAKSLILTLKKFTHIDVLKQLPRTKDPLIFYQYEKLSESLSSDNKKELKIKI